MNQSLFLFVFVLLSCSLSAFGWQSSISAKTNKKAVAKVAAAAAMAICFALPITTKANTQFDDDGNFIPPAEQTWGDRIDKASKMSQRDIFMAAKGAYNRDPSAPESDKAKKRRAMAACRSPEYRDALVIGEIDCIRKVTAGSFSEILEVVDKQQ